jgi:hypothetical protein
MRRCLGLCDPPASPASGLCRNINKIVSGEVIDFAWKEVCCVLAVEVEDLGKAFAKVERGGENRDRAAELACCVCKISELGVTVTFE